MLYFPKRYGIVTVIFSAGGSIVMKEFFQYFFGQSDGVEFTNFTLPHFLPILIMIGVIFLIYRFRKPLPRLCP